MAAKRKPLSDKMAKRKGKAQLKSAAKKFAEVTGIATIQGRPLDYDPDFCILAKKFCLLGATNDSLASSIGVDVGTINRWLKDYPDFNSAVQEGRDVADANVASALYHKAVGFKHPAVKIFNAKQRTVTGEGDTKEIYEESVPLIVPYEEHYAPDTEAIKFWLMNRQRDKWRNKIEVDNPGGSVLVDNSTNVLVHDNRKVININPRQAATEYAKLLAK